MASVLRRESRSRRCDRATRAPASSRSGPSRRGDASACASSPGRPRNLAGAHDFFERVRSSLGWREPQPRVRRNASALSQTLAGRVRGSVRVAARLDLWGARPIAQARSFPLIFEFVFLTFGIARGDWSSGVAGVRTRRLNLVVIFSFSRSSQEKPRPRAPLGYAATSPRTAAMEPRRSKRIKISKEGTSACCSVHSYGSCRMCSRLRCSRSSASKTTSPSRR